MSGPDVPGRLELGQRYFEMRIEADTVAQLERVDGEFEIDQPAVAQLDVERSARRLVRGHFGPHRDHVGDQLGRIARPVERRRESRSASAVLPLGRADRPAGRGSSAICSQVQACSL